MVAHWLSKMVCRKERDKSAMKSNGREVSRASNAAEKDWVDMQEKWEESGGLGACPLEKFSYAIPFIVS